MTETFKSTLKQQGNNTGIQVPAEVIAKLGTSKKPAVVVTVNGNYTYRSSVAVMGTAFMISFSKAHREASGISGGDPIEVTLELDTEPRTVEVPEDLMAALSAKAGAVEVFEKQAFSKRKDFVRQVEEAKTQETRERRIAGIVEKLGSA